MEWVWVLMVIAVLNCLLVFWFIKKHKSEYNELQNVKDLRIGELETQLKLKTEERTGMLKELSELEINNRRLNTQLISSREYSEKVMNEQAEKINKLSDEFMDCINTIGQRDKRISELDMKVEATIMLLVEYETRISEQEAKIKELSAPQTITIENEA